jgi:hypothetical protein
MALTIGGRSFRSDCMVHSRSSANQSCGKQTNKQTNKQPQLPSVTHSGPRRGSLPRLPPPQATSSCAFCACAYGS